ncbi:voltage-dependent calcium channel subunit alpha-2/delta-4-like isoform X1 [Syngnathoides biaculeatus]|uniref:voltage-dependent calcium channel subunit alpha-2/delta-4-like isoform X1 n=1 Tax=Syngnathoides biaculeatus TaxID=300417 RepID=UPI002ADE250B|nr:voltage-dependent calcium channel subunit alpha-2/delta-4-like isoform X1 [Syngnathoides biaculeatus]
MNYGLVRRFVVLQRAAVGVRLLSAASRPFHQIFGISSSAEETEGRGAHHQDGGHRRSGPGQGLRGPDRTHAGQQNEVGQEVGRVCGGRRLLPRFQRHLGVRLLQLDADQHGGRGRRPRGAGGGLPPGGERALQQDGRQHPAEHHPGAHQRLQQRSTAGASFLFFSFLETCSQNGDRPRHPQRHLQLGGPQRRLRGKLPEGPHAHLAVLRQLHRLLQDLPGHQVDSGHQRRGGLRLQEPKLVHPGGHVAQGHRGHGGHQRQHEGPEDDHRQAHHQHHPGHAGRERLRQRHRRETRRRRAPRPAPPGLTPACICVQYTDYVRYVEPCFKGTLVQADLDNREHFKMLVEELHVKGEAKIKNAMKESFKILNEARVSGQGSMCNQAIMLITDGAMEDFRSVFEEFNWPDRRVTRQKRPRSSRRPGQTSTPVLLALLQVRVFTYLIGREMTFAQNTKWIACNNKGYYTHVSTLADVQENVMEYLHVLSRPMVINHDHDIIWTEAYMDTVLPKTKELFNTKAQSLLLMTSVAMPVFSKKKETLSHGILLGVVGTDVPLMEVMKLAPRYMLGAHGYAFLITNNGYILAHPDLRPLYKDGKKLKPKPNYNSVDLSEVEWEDAEQTLRTAMVRGETGSRSLGVRASVENGRRPLFLRNEYFYTNIDDTPFSFGLVLTRGHGKVMFVGNVSVEEGLHDLTSPDLSIASEWTYCETDIDPAHRKYTQLQAAVRYLLGQEPDLECDELLLQQTLFDAVVTAPMEAYWNALALDDRVESGVETAFLGTRAGLMRIMRYASPETRVAKKFLTPADQDNLFTVDHFPLWYRLAVENPPGSFFYYAVNDKGQRAKFAVATTAVTVSAQGKTAVAGAVGLQMSLDLLEKTFWAITQQADDTDCSGVDGLCPLSCQSDDLRCWLVDNHGFILLSKERKEVGRFLGELDGAVMSTLLKMGMYKKVSLFDYQAMCKNSHHHASGGPTPLGPFSVAAAIARWIFSNALMFLLDFNLCGLWHSDYFVDAKAGYHTSHKQKKVEALVPCETAYPGFTYDASVKEANGVIKCGRCQKYTTTTAY